MSDLRREHWWNNPYKELHNGKLESFFTKKQIVILGYILSVVSFSLGIIIGINIMKLF